MDRPVRRTTTYEHVQAIEQLLVSAGLKARSFPDLRPAQWSKLIFNATVNTVAALTDLPHVGSFARVEEPTDLGLLVRDLMDEGKRVAAASGVELHEDPWEMNVHAVRKGETEAAQGAYAHVPSMLDDVRSRRRTEVDFITGVARPRGRALRGPFPCIRPCTDWSRLGRPRLMSRLWMVRDASVRGTVPLSTGVEAGDEAR